MKLLLTALLFLLLTGCSAPAEVPPTEALSREIPCSLLEQYNNAAEAVSLPFDDIQTILPAANGFLIQSENTLALLDPDFQATAFRTLDFTPEISVSHDTVSAFDPQSRQLYLYDLSLQEIHRVTLPSEAAFSPIVSGNRIYYCTKSSIYCWDLDSGIRRRIRDAAYDNQALIGIHWEDTVLQCRIREGSLERDLFLDAQTGQILSELDTTASLDTQDDRYYCIFPNATSDNLIFGTAQTTPTGFFPKSLTARCIFLSESNNALTLENSTLSCYDLETGLLLDTLMLHHTPKAILSQGDTILLLISQDSQDFLLRWTPRKISTDTKIYTAPWYTADNPDHAGLSRCQDYARQISDIYGVDILIWKDAADVSPWDYDFIPEYRYPVILSRLQLLEHCLARYPKEILSQTAGHFDALKICLVQSIAGTAGEYSLSAATGIQFLTSSDSHVVLATGPYMEQALYHELFHVMETHILSRSNALDQWNELNPSGFSYDLSHAYNAQRNSGVYLEGTSRAFVDTYSMSFPKEDRARIFEYAMLPDMEYLFQPEIMQRKLSALCTGIRDAYRLENTPEAFPWEQYLQ